MTAFRFPLILVGILLLLGFISYGNDSVKETLPAPELLDEPLDDPLPIQRVLLPPDRLAAELEKAKQGVYLTLSRGEFESLVQRAARSQLKNREPPHLVEGIYKARWEQDASGNENLIGSGEWKIVALSPRPALLNIEPLSLALQQARWQDNRYAVLGLLDASPQSGMQLLIESKGEPSLYFDWSSRGILEPGEVRFDLQIPAAPLAKLELNLPPNLTPFVSQSEVLLSGPIPQGEGAERRHVWMLAFGGISRLELLLRKPDATRPQPLIRSRTTTTQTMSQNQLSSKFDLNWEVFRGTVRDLTLLLEGEQTPTEVVVNNLESWRLLNGPNQRNQLEVRLREPSRGGRVEISTTAPRFSDETVPWSSPGITLQGSSSRGETLELRLAADLLLADWQPGNFQLVNSRLETDRTQVFTLQSSFITEGLSPQRPQARLRSPAPEYQLQESSEWHLLPEMAALSVQYQLEVSRGALIQVPIRLPKEWELDAVETPVKESQPHATRQGNQVLFEFPKPIVPGQKYSFVAKFVQRNPPLGTERQKTIPFPELIPIGSPRREGSFRIKISPAFQGTVTAPLTGEAPTQLPGGDPTWELKFTGQPPAGLVYLQPRKASFTARCESEITLANRRLNVRHRVQLKPERGLIPSLTFLLPVAIEENFEIRTVEGTNSIKAIKCSPKENRQTEYELILAQPLDSPLTLEWQLEPQRSRWSPVQQHSRVIALAFGNRNLFGFLAQLNGSDFPPAPESLLPVPLLHPVGFEWASEKITVRRTGKEPYHLEATGLTGDLRANPATLLASNPKPILHLKPGPAPAVPAKVETAQLTTAVDRTRTVRHLLDLQLDPGSEEEIHFDFDRSVFVEAVAIDGRSPSLLRWIPQVLTGDNRLTLPLPEGTGKRRVEIVYHRPRGRSFFLQEIEAALPHVSIPLPAVQHRWRLGPGFDPAQAEQLFPLPAGEFVPSVYRLPGEIREPLTDWLHLKREAELTPEDQPPSLFWMLHAEGLHWTAWQGEDSSRITLVRERAMFLVGGFLGCLVILFAGLRLGRSRKRNAILLQFAFLLGVGATLILPETCRDLARGPLLALLLVAILFAFPPRRTRSEDQTVLTRRRPIGSSSGKLVATILLLGSPALLAAPEVYSVYLIPDSKRVLVPPALIDKLNELTAESSPLAGPVLLRDHYTLRISDNLLEGKVQYLLHSPTETKTNFPLPLSGVRLREVLLNGAQAFPQNLGGDRFTIEVKGKGEHRLELLFTVPIVGQGSDREVRFGIPETGQGRVEFVAEQENLRELELLNWRGQQRSNRDGKRTVLQAELGRTRNLHLRWRQEGKTTRVLPRVTELYFWEIDPSTSTLFASLEYRFGANSGQQLHLAIPKELEVTRLDFRPVGTVQNPPPAWIRDWRFTHETPRDGFRHLVVDLQVPVTQTARLQLELIPTRPPGPKPTLIFPFALEVAESDALAAYRLQRLELLQEGEKQGGTDFLAASFFNDFWSKIGFGPNGIPLKALRRTQNETLVGRPQLMLPSTNLVGSQSLDWFLTDRRSEVRAEATWKSPSANLAFVEWSLPQAVNVMEVRGPEVRSWSRVGSRVQVWLQRPLSEVKLQWTGSISRPADNNERFAFDLPTIKLEGVSSQTLDLELKTLPGWSISPEKVTGLNSLPGQEEVPHYESRLPQYSGRFWIRSPQRDAAFRTVQKLKVVDQQLTLEALIVPELKKDRPHEVVLDLRAFGDCEATLLKNLKRGNEKVAPVSKNRWSLSLLEQDECESFTLKLTRTIPRSEFRFPSLQLLQGDRTLPGQHEIQFDSSGWSLRPGTLDGEEAILSPRPVEKKVEPPPAETPTAIGVLPSRSASELLIRLSLLLGLVISFSFLTFLAESRTRLEQVALASGLTALGFELPEALAISLIGIVFLLAHGVGIFGWLLRRGA